ncbi:hypothetical protein ACFPAF_05035 [Hymenobacter endophyticus]|uniref:PEGA domain-containing protein n=1 Tax=Hymenobacter endophyticus TaxID=3076335 RepID=A0ABU3TEQ5_9BACT|nr:hypothetical protein [Hymenobacter endophyticus]MDU0369750.1 hypothetical protein [Hymenobacter endophyticus]
MRHLLLVLCGLLLTLRATAQDVILLSNGEELTGKVLTITPELVTYINSSADTLRVAATQVFLIRYPNGTKDVFQRQATAAPALPGLAQEATYDQGRRDARAYFKAPGAFWGTYGATIVTIAYGGIGGVATGMGISLTPPKKQNMRVPDPALLKSPNYVAGYQHQARNKKFGNAAGGYGAGVGTVVALVVALFFINGGVNHM